MLHGEIRKVLAMVLALCLALGCCALATEDTEMEREAEVILGGIEATEEAEENLYEAAIDGVKTVDNENGGEEVVNEGAAAQEDGEKESGCTHPNLEIRDNYFEPLSLLSDMTPSTHTYMGTLKRVEYCDDCGYESSTVIESDAVLSMPHNFSEGVCNGCGYVLQCPHNSDSHYEYESGYSAIEYSNITDSTHDATGLTAVNKICDLCGHTIETEYVETTITGNHLYNSEGRCMYCGQETNCDYTNASHKTVIDNGANLYFTDITENTHTVVGWMDHVMVCPDCGCTQYEGRSERWESTVEQHDFDDQGICKKCGYESFEEGDCTHPTKSYEAYLRDCTYQQKDGQTHVLTGYVTIEVYCLDCDIMLEEIETSEIRNIEERHFYEDGICTGCGYADGCAHEHVITEFWEGWDGGSTYTDNGDGTHTRSGHRWSSESKVCSLCGEELEVNREDGDATETEKHRFWEGKCRSCGAENSCTHANVQSETELTEERCTPIDGRAHKVAAKTHILNYCPDCGESWYGETSTEEIEENEAHSFFRNVCQWCGYVNPCTHENVEEIEKIVPVWNKPGGCYTDCDAQYHTVYANVEHYNRCKDCGEQLEFLYSDVVPDLKEEHVFVNGICDCGYVQPTVEPTATPTPEPTEAPTATPTAEPTNDPTVTLAPVEPTETPTVTPAPNEPTEAPTETPTAEPTVEPTMPAVTDEPAEPTATPTAAPTMPAVTDEPIEPTAAPTEEPTTEPTDEPTAAPTEEPTTEPTDEPTNAPTDEPTEAPTEEPTVEPTMPAVTDEPIATPTPKPTAKATPAPAAEQTIAEAMMQLSEDVIAEGGEIEIIDAERLLTGEELAALSKLPVKERLLTFLSAIGLQEQVNLALENAGERLSEDAIALRQRIQDRIAQMDAAALAEFEAELREFFGEELIVTDDGEIERFAIKLEIRTGDRVRRVRYGFHRAGENWFFDGMEPVE